MPSDTFRRDLGDRLVDALLASAVSQSAGALVSDLRREFGDRLIVPGDVSVRRLLGEVVTVGMDLPGALRSVADHVWAAEPRTDRSAAVVRLVDEWDVVELFGDFDIEQLRSGLGSIDDASLLGRIADDVGVTLPDHAVTGWQMFASFAGRNGRDGDLACFSLLDRFAVRVPRISAVVRGFLDNVRSGWGMAGGAQSGGTPPPSVAEVRQQFYVRLGEDWRYLADFLEIPLADQRRFAHGHEAHAIWHWLAGHGRLADLSAGLAGIGRFDLEAVVGTLDVETKTGRRT